MWQKAISAVSGGGSGNAPKFEILNISTSTFSTVVCDFAPTEVLCVSQTPTGYFMNLKYDVENDIKYYSLNGGAAEVTALFDGCIYCSGNTVYLKAPNSYHTGYYTVVVSDKHFD